MFNEQQKRLREKQERRKEKQKLEEKRLKEITQLQDPLPKFYEKNPLSIKIKSINNETYIEHKGDEVYDQFCQYLKATLDDYEKLPKSQQQAIDDYCSDVSKFLNEYERNGIAGIIQKFELTSEFIQNKLPKIKKQIDNLIKQLPRMEQELPNNIITFRGEPDIYDVIPVGECKKWDFHASTSIDVDETDLFMQGNNPCLTVILTPKGTKANVMLQKSLVDEKEILFKKGQCRQMLYSCKKNGYTCNVVKCINKESDKLSMKEINDIDFDEFLKEMIPDEYSY